MKDVTMNAITMTRILFVGLLVHLGDRMALVALASKGGVELPPASPVIEMLLSQEGLVEEYNQVADLDGEDIRWESGMGLTTVEEQDVARVRLIRDTLENSVRQLYGKNNEVTTWADAFGGLRKVQEMLCGISLSPDMWFVTTCREMFYTHGFHVKPLGEPLPLEGLDSATDYTSYAVEAHRMACNRRAYGEVDDIEDITTTPDWKEIQRNSELQFRPTWWRKVAIGKFNSNVRELHGAYQTESRKAPNWIPDIRVGAEIGGTPWDRITKYGPWSVMQDNTVVKQFLDLFYNDPRSLVWKKIGYGDKQRWACGMRTKGPMMWAPVSYRSSSLIDFMHRLESGEKFERKGTRALYWGPDWVIAYRKVGDKILFCRMKQSNQVPSLWEIHKREMLEPREWGKVKREYLKRGAVDAYLGRPWKRYVKPVEYKEADF